MTVQVAIATVFALAASVIVNVWALIGQATASGSAETAQQLIPAAALTGTSACLVWVVKQIVSGNLVHREPLADAANNRKALEASTHAIEASTKAIERLLSERASNDR